MDKTSYQREFQFQVLHVSHMTFQKLFRVGIHTYTDNAQEFS